VLRGAEAGPPSAYDDHAPACGAGVCRDGGRRCCSDRLHPLPQQHTSARRAGCGRPCTASQWPAGWAGGLLDRLPSHLSLRPASQPPGLPIAGCVSCVARRGRQCGTHSMASSEARLRERADGRGPSLPRRRTAMRRQRAFVAPHLLSCRIVGREGERRQRPNRVWFRHRQTAGAAGKPAPLTRPARNQCVPSARAPYSCPKLSRTVPAHSVTSTQLLFTHRQAASPLRRTHARLALAGFLFLSQTHRQATQGPSYTVQTVTAQRSYCTALHAG
jgi:hypothetical protein